MENDRIILAQKGVKDPVLEKLKQKKKQWNALVSGVIHLLIGAKQGINGRGNMELGLPPSNIKDPLPREISGIMRDLAAEFQKIVQEAQDIIQEQEHFSQTRRKSQPKGLPSPNMPPANDNGLKAASTKPSLISLAHSLQTKWEQK